MIPRLHEVPVEAKHAMGRDEAVRVILRLMMGGKNGDGEEIQRMEGAQDFGEGDLPTPPDFRPGSARSIPASGGPLDGLREKRKPTLPWRKPRGLPSR